MIVTYRRECVYMHVSRYLAQFGPESYFVNIPSSMLDEKGAKIAREHLGVHIHRVAPGRICAHESDGAELVRGGLQTELIPYAEQPVVYPVFQFYRPTSCTATGCRPALLRRHGLGIARHRALVFVAAQTLGHDGRARAGVAALPAPLWAKNRRRSATLLSVRCARSASGRRGLPFYIAGHPTGLHRHLSHSAAHCGDARQQRSTLAPRLRDKPSATKRTRITMCGAGVAVPSPLGIPPLRDRNTLRRGVQPAELLDAATRLAFIPPDLGRDRQTTC